MRKHTIIKALATAGAATLVATGCSDGGDDSQSEQSTSSSQSSSQFNEADVEYARGMKMHHEQAVEMSDIILGKSGVDSDVREMAQQIKKAQGPEIKEMESWLEDWGQDSDGDMDHEGRMSDMDHEGMMTAEDLSKLKNADGDQASTLFLDQMIEHHQGAVKMAKEHRQDGKNSDAVDLSADVIRDQKAEIEEMREMRTSL